MKQIKVFLIFLLLKCCFSQRKPFQNEYYPQELEQDNNMIPDDNFYRTNMRDPWSQIETYNNLMYQRNPYMNIPMLPYSQPGVRLYLKTYNMPNPIGLNYPKTPYLRSSQYSNYARVLSPKENHRLKRNRKKDVNIELTKVLEKEIAQLHTLTEQAKKIAEKKKKEEESQKNKLSNNEILNQTIIQQQKSFLQMRENNRLLHLRKMRRSNLDELNLDPKQKLEFDEKIKNMMERLSKIEY